MANTRRKFTAAFKADVALAAIGESETITQLARRYKIHANQIYKRKRELLENASNAFGQEDLGDSSEREAELLQKVGELTMERDFLARGLGGIQGK